jgi:hypothetical protein
MSKLSPGEYQCPICSALLVTRDGPERPIAVLTSRGGELTQRVVTTAGFEIHRCPFPGLLQGRGSARHVA